MVAFHTVDSYDIPAPRGPAPAPLAGVKRSFYLLINIILSCLSLYNVNLFLSFLFS